MDEAKKEKIIQEIVTKYNLTLLLLFGSQVSGKTHKESDFDVAYVSERELELMEKATLNIELAPIFGSERIDIVNLKNASPLLRYAIFNNCRVLYQKDEMIFPSLRAYAFKRYVEAKPVYELKFQRLQEAIKQL